MSDATDKWNAKLKELYANRKGPKGESPPRTPINNDLEEKICIDMEGIFLNELTEEERKTVERPVEPRIRNSLIAQDEFGRLIGYEVDSNGNEI